MRRARLIAKEIYYTLDDYGRNRGGVHSAQIAFFMMLSIFPLLTSLVAILSLFKIDLYNLMVNNAQVFPLETSRFIMDYILNVKTSNNILILSYSVIMALWSSSKAMYSIQFALDKVYNVTVRKHYVLMKLLSVLYNFLFVIFLIVIIIAPTLIQIGIELFERYLWPLEGLRSLLVLIRYLVQVVAMFGIICLIFMRLPTRKKPFREIWLGALFTTMAWIIASQLFTFFMANFSRTNAIYGALNVFILLSLWFNINATLLLIGAHINRRFQFRRQFGSGLFQMQNRPPGAVWSDGESSGQAPE